MSDDWGTLSDAEWLRRVGITQPLPEVAPWHSSAELLVRAGFYVQPWSPTVGGEMWAVGLREERGFRWLIIVLIGKDGPEFYRGIQTAAPNPTWLDEVEFLDHVLTEKRRIEVARGRLPPLENILLRGER